MGTYQYKLSHISRKLLLIILSACFWVMALGAISSNNKVSAAACTAPTTDYGTVTQTVNVPTATTYKVWSRMKAASTDVNANSYMLEITSGGVADCYTVGNNSAISKDNWTWVDYQSGTTTNKIQKSLSGTVTVKMIGLEPGVQLDRLLFLSPTDTCITTSSTDKGDACTVTPDTQAPTNVAVTQPTTGARLGGSITIAANANDNVGVTKVEFYRSGSTAPIGTAPSSPYSISWDSRTVADGQYTITAKAYDAAGNNTPSPGITITVDQSAVPPRVTRGLQGLYDFKEGSGATVNNKHAGGTAPSLAISNTSAIQWLTSEGQGVNFTNSAASAIKSSANATALISAIKSTDKLTLEAWITPADTTQGGPARIATISNGTATGDVNAHIGQEGTAVSNRLRTSSTTYTGTNGTALSSTTQPSHVVITYDGANRKTYVNGNEIFTSAATGNLDSWLDYPLTLGNESTYTTPTDSRPWKGKMYLFAVYNEALTAAEVQTNFSAGKSGGGATPTNTPPTVSLTSPTSGANFTAPATITISANAADSDGIQKVEFYQGTTLLNTDTVAPYSFTWGSVPAGTYSITAKAYDNGSPQASTTSSAVSVSVTGTQTKPGDFTGSNGQPDGSVNALDFLVFKANYGKCGTQVQNPATNMDGSTDGCVGPLDFLRFKAVYGT